MDNPETLTTLGTQDTGRWQTKQKKKQNRKLKKISSMDASKTRGWYPYMIRNIAELTLPFNTVSSSYQSLCCHIVNVYTHLVYRVCFVNPSFYT